MMDHFGIAFFIIPLIIIGILYYLNISFYRRITEINGKLFETDGLILLFMLFVFLTCSLTVFYIHFWFVTFFRGGFGDANIAYLFKDWIIGFLSILLFIQCYKLKQIIDKCTIENIRNSREIEMIEEEADKIAETAKTIE